MGIQRRSVAYLEQKLLLAPESCRDVPLLDGQIEQPGRDARSAIFKRR